ncbi:3-oxoacyl-ACP reductase family protein [Trinickia acidisoli]|uniref:3-oxoacyl-ACP reductase family protein n=1 Tax=Trinickia acidisoli TaxID=2767482 RepID=UPI001A8BF8F3|nr:3-oxoacyl-ACP reductase family protein [Trinickia acidisoli]
MTRLTGKVALVTGASRGIGVAIARRMAQEGADVAITYASSAAKAIGVVKEITETGRRGLALVADSADPHAVVEAVDRTVAELGRIDILVSNAGIGYWKTFDEFTFDEFEHIMAVNVRAVFAGAQAAARHMGEGGRIITIGSCNAERVPLPGSALYAMSKSALIGLTKGIARDLGPRGITANLVQPGPIDTDMNPADGAHADSLRALMALGHYGNGEDIGGFVAYLASDEGRFITGAALTIDGGYNI